MAVDVSKLRESKFWMQKMDRSLRLQDADNSGDISRADVVRVRERYKETIYYNPQKLEAFLKYESEFLKRMGLIDESATLSYAEYKEKIIENLSRGGKFEPILGASFDNFDLDGDGVISFEEWKAYYYCFGIDQAHARASFDAMDTNSDGKVSKDEFVNFFYEFHFTAENKL